MATEDEEIGSRIAAIRSTLGLSQSGLAEELRRAGLPWDQRTVSRVEQGQRSVRFAEVYRLAGVLEVDPTSFAPKSEGLVGRVNDSVHRLHLSILDLGRARTRVREHRSSVVAWQFIRELAEGSSVRYVVHGSIHDLMAAIGAESDASADYLLGVVIYALAPSDADTAGLIETVALEAEAFVQEGVLPTWIEDVETMMTFPESERVDDRIELTRWDLLRRRVATILADHYPKVSFVETDAPSSLLIEGLMNDPSDASDIDAIRSVFPDLRLEVDHTDGAVRG